MPTSFRCLKVATVLAFAVSALTLSAQVKAASGPTSTVVYVSGDDLVLKAADGKLLNYTVAPGTKFAAGARTLTLAELKPGTQLTKEVATGFDPKIISGVQVVKGKVFAVTPPDGVTLSLADGIKELAVPAGTTFTVDGNPIKIDALKPNMVVEATIVTTIADTAKPEVANAPAPQAPAQTGTLLVAKTLGDDAAALPEAGTNLPLLGLSGIILLALGAVLFFVRKPATQA
jgi:LPXTG-motif cell wall-anchored protein